MPFSAQNVDELKKFILEKDLNFENEKLDGISWDLLSKMLQKDPSKWISLEESLEHPFIFTFYKAYDE